MVQIGKMDRIIRILNISKTLDSVGQPQITTSLFHKAFAYVVPRLGKEIFIDGREMAVRTYKFKIRYKEGVHEEMRVEYEGEQYDITNIAPLGDRNRHFLEITAEYRKETGIKG